MHLLALDIGSSAVKAAILRNGKRVSRIARATFPTCYDGRRAEINPDDVQHAIAEAAAQLGAAAGKADLIALATLGPSWVAMDARGRALTPIITHHDRRSVQVAQRLEARVGKERHLRLAGNRPFPGGISSTTCAWFLEHHPAVMRRADLVGHLTTFIHRTCCGVRVTDPSHASFMGLYSTLDLAGWNDELCQAVGVSPRLLPEVRDAGKTAGWLLPVPARRLNLTPGTPMLVGMIDTGAAVLLTGARPGQLVEVCGSTQVLALCTARARPGERLLTRALGVGRKWLSVYTIAAAGSALDWARRQLFADQSERQFQAMLARMARQRGGRGTVNFEPYLAGDRMSIEQRCAAFTGLTLSTTRQQMLTAIIDSLASSGGEAIRLLAQTGTLVRRRVMVSGGAGTALSRILHRDWPGRWTFHMEHEATLRGLALLASK